MDYFLLIVGFVLLIKGADYFVEGCASVAKKFNIPSMIIGLTIVAMGTSAPETAVSVAAAIKGSNELAISNISGSNMFNLMVVCGLCALMLPLFIDKKTLKREFPFSIIVGALLLVFAVTGREVGRIEGIILMVLFAGFLYYMVYSARKAMAAGEEVDVEVDEIKDISMMRCIFYILIGAVAIAGGGDLVVDSASNIALHFGLSQTLIGLTIVALGTSLPELVTSLTAARKNELDMAIGNVVGSNIFNILLVIGVASAISPIGITTENIYDLVVMILMCLMVLILVISGEHKIDKKKGLLMLVVYIAYIVYTCIR